MTDTNKIFNQQSIRFIDHTYKQNKPWESFAIDDALAEEIRSNQQATIRIWSHEKTVVLGIADTRLPYLEEGLNLIKDAQYISVVRNSGGLAVVNDAGVLNISILLPDEKDLTIDQGYEQMVQLIKDVFKPWTNEIEAYEVVGSYCPGDYDLSIHGKKFAGISQRRVKGGIAVQIYLSIEGDQMTRSDLVKRFYQTALKNEQTRFTYPTIQPETMASLDTLLNTSLTVKEVIDRLKELLQSESDVNEDETLTENERVIYQKRREQMIKRNEKALGQFFES
ncbi:octanoyl-[GcvH]:protein N-octanoyltransferase [Pelagirhabdus alkalitolerans]|uniref:Octanoyl-[GcvH]:protein N-octanoyltransferase n=1 Tax=Pelagirhabdus alkalitolerans TaxID=1612202 RepID=A0A1G6GI15_9BACI|nr:biotin/lipoate A/B protein ligase family protein [Pelagirhabdus alkalitolerans]SDB81662.1 octanoyl-[GcvH]:protein N-octanoyltransferase [Pelagirhabdus alkalitolerans]